MKTNRQIRGQGLVEFALVLPLILLVIIVFIELGRIVYYYSALNSAVREGARYAIVTQFKTTDDINLIVYGKVAHYAVTLPLNPAEVSVYCLKKDNITGTITTTPINGNYPCKDYVSVSADIEIEPMVAVFAQMIGVGDTFRITAKSTMQTTPYGNYPKP